MPRAGWRGSPHSAAQHTQTAVRAVITGLNNSNVLCHHKGIMHSLPGAGSLGAGASGAAGLGDASGSSPTSGPQRARRRRRRCSAASMMSALSKVSQSVYVFCVRRDFAGSVTAAKSARPCSASGSTGQTIGGDPGMFVQADLWQHKAARSLQ